MADTDKNTEEFANSLGIGMNRFNELSGLVAVVLEHNENAPWSAVVHQCIRFGKNALEVAFIGMILGRTMQESICGRCSAHATEVPMVLMVIRTDKPIPS
jgi:hypothetical protein